MTALSLYDHLAHSQQPDFAEKLAQSSLADLNRLRDYEREFASEGTDDPQHHLDLLRSLWTLYAEWADDAQKILSRIRQLAASGSTVTGADELSDAHIRVRARLAVSPEKIAAAKEQVRQGKSVPIEDLRHELQTRLRR